MKPRYTVLERLGGGGQAEVFRGTSETLQGFKKSVAIKRVLPNLTSNSQGAIPYIEDAPTLNMSGQAISPVGGSQPHTNFQPYLCVDFIISLFGIFPSPT